MVLIYTTCGSTEEAVKLGHLIVSRHLAAAVNIWPLQSIFREGDRIETRLEAGLLVKTVEVKLQQIEELIEANHGYAVPFIGAWDVRRINRAYKERMAAVIH